MSNSTKSNSDLQIIKSNTEPSEPKMKASSITKIRGKDTATYDGLLDFAHQHGIDKLEVELIQFPSKENDHTAICRAKLDITSGGTFSDIGDASPSNTPSGCSAHYIRMASTRAKARVLCDAFNIKSKINSDHDNDKSSIDAEFTVVEKSSISEAKPSSNLNPISPKQISMLKGLASKQNMNDEELESIARHKFNKEIHSLSTKEAHLLIKHIG